jgi:hypothetical protein
VADDLQGTTHAEGCHTWGHRHYECALAAIARKDAEIAAANAEIDELVRALKLCTQRAERAEARVDALMLEYCPDEMEDEQRAEWARNQVPAIDAARKEGV